MSTPTNRWKLGLFIVIGTLLVLGVGLFLGTRSLRTETVDYASYFNESVTGLDLGSPVKFRGVTIGSVSSIDIAPDRRHVEIVYQLGVIVLGRLGLAAGHGQLTTLPIPPDLRAQLGSSGITGVKYISLDFFESRANPVMKLPFPVRKNYIPTAPSTMKNLEDSVVRAVDEFPRLASELGFMLAHTNRLLSQIEDENLPTVLSGMASNVNRTVELLHTKLEHVETEKLSSQAQLALGQMTQVMTSMQRLIERLDGDRGVLTSVQRATDGMGDVANSARESGPGLAATMRDLREAADSVRQLADTLELDSDMLIKGRARAPGTAKP
jgi:phospholipid/cholesterol/gamma-HCH transport system substrate-binding protein